MPVSQVSPDAAFQPYEPRLLVGQHQAARRLANTLGLLHHAVIKPAGERHLKPSPERSASFTTDDRAGPGARFLHRPATSVGAQAVGARAVGSLALAAVAVGALAIGALAVGRLTIGRARIRRLEIDELVVRRLRIIEQLQTPPNLDSKR